MFFLAALKKRRRTSALPAFPTDRSVLELVVADDADRPLKADSTRPFPTSVLALAGCPCTRQHTTNTAQVEKDTLRPKGRPQFSQLQPKRHFTSASVCKKPRLVPSSSSDKHCTGQTLHTALLFRDQPTHIPIMPTRIWPQLASTTRCEKMAARIKRLHKILLRPIGRRRVRMHVELQSADCYKFKIQYLTTVLLIMSLLYIERLNINSEKQIKTEYSHRTELQNLSSSTTIL
ncbi:hypothetical protein D917_00612 [Trichinella nativa]|uniref:Uncharacterized protein n=1 Tax=Trichinella nativa TaxID=6335 RepID=A0A1Y3E823_9BILA|nr:hypothetical protein D917_00612 [Trichinella nativa]